MDAPPLHCPFCNAAVGDPRPIDGRLSCPRCGELIPRRLWDHLSLPDRPADRPSATAGPKRYVGLTLATVLLSMLLMAGVTVAFALRTVDVRREHDTRMPKRKNQPEDVVALAPDELAGLGYVTADVPVVAGLHVAQLRESPLGQAVLKSLGGGSLQTNAIPLDPTQVESVVIGVDPGKLPPRIHWTVHSRGRIDPKTVADATKSRSETRGGKTLNRFRFPPGQPQGVELAYWLPNERTMLFGLPDDFARVPAVPKSGVAHLHPELTTLVGGLPRTSQAWVVGHFTEGAAAGRLLAAMAMPDQKWLGGVRTLAASVSPTTDGVRVTAAVTFETTTAAEAFRTQLDAWLEAAGVPSRAAITDKAVSLDAPLPPAAWERWAERLGSNPKR